MDTTYNNFLSPKAIRAKIDLNSDFDFRKITARFKEVYCILTQQGPKRTGTSLAIAQALLCGDQSLPPAVTEEGFQILQKEIEILARPRARKIVLRQKVTVAGEEQRETSTCQCSEGKEQVSDDQAAPSVGNSSNLYVLSEEADVRVE